MRRNTYARGVGVLSSTKLIGITMPNKTIDARRAPKARSSYLAYLTGKGLTRSEARAVAYAESRDYAALRASTRDNGIPTHNRTGRRGLRWPVKGVSLVARMVYEVFALISVSTGLISSAEVTT